jgi:hypothetical protein
VFAALINGIRPGNEICSLDIGDVDLKECEITVTRKNSQENAERRQTIAFRRDLVPILEKYISLRKTLLGKAEFKNVSDEKDAFFVRTNPFICGRISTKKPAVDSFEPARLSSKTKKKGSWRLNEYGLALAYSEMLEDLHEPKHRPYLLRHASITNQVENARLFGLDVEEVARRNDQSAKTCLTHYNDIIRYGVEILTREPKELISFLEQFCIFHLIKFIRAPRAFRHFAAYNEAMSLLGKVQFRESLKEYHTGESIDPISSVDLERIRDFLAPQSNRVAQNLSWEEALGRQIRRSVIFNNLPKKGDEYKQYLSHH